MRTIATIVFKLALIALLLVLLTCTFSSCGSKKEISTTNVEKRIDTIFVTKTQIDTIYKEKIITKTLPATSGNVIDNPCDEEGNIRPINTTTRSGNATMSVYSKDGKLYIDQKIDSTYSSVEKEYRSKFVQDSIALRSQLLKELVSESEVVRYVWPWWVYALIVWGVVSLALNLYQKFGGK